MWELICLKKSWVAKLGCLGNFLSIWNPYPIPLKYARKRNRLTEFICRDKTRILVTHSAKYLPQMDRIFVMKDGQISEQGNYHELLAAGGEFADFLVQYLTEEQENGSEIEDEESMENLKQSLQKVMGKEKLQRQMSKALSQRSQRTKSQR